MWNWIKSLFNHPKTTITGIGALAGAAAVGYGMSSGKVPMDATNMSIAGGLASAGLSGIFGKDAEPTKLIDTATASAVAAAPAMDLVKQFQSMQLEANTAQDKLTAFATVSNALAQALPPQT